MCYSFTHIQIWVDAHANLPTRARWIAKADVVPSGTTKRDSVDPPPTEGFLFSDTSIIDANTVQAYLETAYHVHARPPFALHIGQHSAALTLLHRTHGVDCSAFITAWNPYSKPTVAQENARLQQALVQSIQGMHLQALPGLGQHPSSQWPREESFLVLGLDLTRAKALGEQFGQNAIVWAGPDAVPNLVLLR